MAAPATSDAASAARLPMILRLRLSARQALGVPRAARESLRWDLLAGACAGAFLGATNPFLTRIARGELGASETAIAVMTAAPFVGNLLAPIWARQMDGRQKMPFCLGSWIGGRGLLLLMPLIAGPGPFVGVIALMLFIATIGTPAYTTLMRDIYPDRSRGRLIGYVRVVLQCAMFFTTLSVGRLLDGVLSYRVVFPVAGLLGISAALFFSRVRPLPERVAEAREAAVAASVAAPVSSWEFARDTLSILRDNIGYRWFALSVFTYGFGNLMVQPLYQLYQVDRLGISNTQIANLINVGSLFAIGGAFFWGRFIDRYGAPRAVLWGIVLISLLPLVYLNARSVPPLLIASALSGFGFAGIELSYLASILQYAEPQRAAQYQALHSLLLGVRGVLAPLIGVPLMQRFGYHTAFWSALILMLIGVGLQWAAVRRGEPHGELRA